MIFKSPILFFILCIFVTGQFIISPSLYAQDFGDINFADYLFNNGKYYDAITEYKRVLFFKPANINDGRIYHRIGLCYKNGGYFDNSLYYLTRAMETEINLDRKYKYQYDFAKIWMNKKGYGTAEMELTDLLDKGIPETFSDSVNYLLGWNSLHEFNWIKAESFFQKISHKNRNTKTLIELAKQSSRLKIKSPELALILSTFIPGAGQVYSGKVFDGLVAFVLNSTIIYYLTDSFIDKRWTDTALIYYFLFGRFYTANRNNAYNYALEYNLKTKSQYLAGIKKTVGFDF